MHCFRALEALEDTIAALAPQEPGDAEQEAPLSQDDYDQQEDAARNA